MPIRALKALRDDSGPFSMKKTGKAKPTSSTGQEIASCFNGIDLDTPFHWISEEVAHPQSFFEHLHMLLPADAILYFEGTTIAPAIAAFYEAHQSEGRVPVVRDTILPTPKVYHVKFCAEVVRFLVDQSGRRSVAEMFDHVKAYSGRSILFTFHDAFCGWLCISEHVPEARVKAFFAELCVSYSREQTKQREPKQFEGLLNHMIAYHFRRKVFRIWIWVCILTVILLCYPVAYRTTRVLETLGLVLSWAGALFLWKRKRATTVSLIGAALICLAIVSLPARPVKIDALAQDYCKALRTFRGVHYVWGGEGLLGIDCSGLVRQGAIWGQLEYGLSTLNGRPIRNALSLWWNDCSAEGMRDGFSGLTHVLFEAESISTADDSRLRPGDLAVTADGVHVLAYLGERTWIEADPNVHKAIEVTLPTSNAWFQVPAVIVRWEFLSSSAEIRRVP